MCMHVFLRRLVNSNYATVLSDDVWSNPWQYGLKHASGYDFFEVRNSADESRQGRVAVGYARKGHRHRQSLVSLATTRHARTRSSDLFARTHPSIPPRIPLPARPRAVCRAQVLPANYRPPSSLGPAVPTNAHIYNANPFKPRYNDYFDASKRTGTEFKRCAIIADAAAPSNPCHCTDAMRRSQAVADRCRALRVCMNAIAWPFLRTLVASLLSPAGRRSLDPFCRMHSSSLISLTRSALTPFSPSPSPGPPLFAGPLSTRSDCIRLVPRWYFSSNFVPQFNVLVPHQDPTPLTLPYRLTELNGRRDYCFNATDCADSDAERRTFLDPSKYDALKVRYSCACTHTHTRTKLKEARENGEPREGSAQDTIAQSWKVQVLFWEEVMLMP